MTEPRERVVQALYRADQLHDHTLEPELEGKALRLTSGVLERLDELDSAIDAVAEHWRIGRMPVVDRAVIRLGLYELRYEKDTPTAVILSEAVRIAKAFSTENSGRFVNGVLATLARRERDE